MKKKKNIWIRPALLFSLSAVLLLLSTVGSTRAALTYYSADYAVQVEIKSIGVSLLENNRVVSYRNYAETGSNEFVEGGTGLLKNESGESDRFGAGEGQEKLIPGKMYDEKLSVRNTGAIDEYVRVVVTRSWQDADGKKATDLDPGLIGLSLDGQDLDEFTEKNGWIKDTKAAGSDHERTVLYYTHPVASQAQTPAICDTLCLDGALLDEYETKPTEKPGVVKTTYKYNGYMFVLEAEVDAVQTHNAEDAIKSAWGVDVNIAPDGTLSLK